MCCIWRESDWSDVQEETFVHGGVELTQEKLADALNPIPTTPDLRASRRRPLSVEGIRLRHC